MLRRMTDPAVSRRWRNVLWATAAVALAAFGVLGWAAASGPLPIDRSVASALLPLHAGAVGSAIDVIDVLGSALVWDAIVALVGVALWLRGLRLAAAVLVLGLLGGEAAGSIAKLVVGRGRPAGVEVTELITQAGYPSGHVLRCVVPSGLGVALGWPHVGQRAGRQAGIAAIAAAVIAVVMMGVARVASGEHWFTDVVGAVLLGIAVLAIIGVVVGAVTRRGAGAP
jgi:undecaprenyl-diphosphatase